MSAGCMRLVLSRTVRAVCDVSPAHWASASRFPICSERSNIAGLSRRWSPFSAAVGDAEQTPAPKKKKQGPTAQATIWGLGRMIPQDVIHVMSDTDEDLGHMHSSNAIRMMDEQDLKLVLLDQDKDPPVYKLMSGKQIHEEQLKRQEKAKAKAAPVQVKQLTFSSNIAAHDLATKLKSAEFWLEKKQHVRITVRCGRGEPAVDPDATLEQMVQRLGVKVGFVAKPRVTQNGRAATCVLRLPSAKELRKELSTKKEKSKAAELSTKKEKSKAATTATPNKSVSNTDTSKASAQKKSA